MITNDISLCHFLKLQGVILLIKGAIIKISLFRVIFIFSPLILEKLNQLGQDFCIHYCCNLISKTLS